MIVFRWVGALCLLLLGLVAFTPLTNLMRPATAGPLQPAQAIVVLGSRMGTDGTLSAASLQRTVQGIRLQQRGLAPLLVMAGPRQGEHVEAEVRAALARDFGVPAAAVLTDASGRTTRDEARGMAALLHPRGIRRILLVTSAEHMRRARREFEQQGFEVVPAPVGSVDPEKVTPEHRLGDGRRWLEETMGRLYYRLRGR